MNKNAVIAGLAVTLTLATFAYIGRAEQSKKDLDLKQQKIEWYKLRYHIATEELNFAYKNMDPWERTKLKDLFDKNEAFIEVAGRAVHPDFK